MNQGQQAWQTEDVALRPSWALCIPTLNRVEVLEQSLPYALRQTVPPAEVIIVDTSDDWRGNADRIRRLFEREDAPKLIYTTCEKRSGAAQRNVALGLATADILFFFDDDTFLHTDCAACLLDVYAADPQKLIAGVTAPNDPVSPAQRITLQAKATGAQSVGRLSAFRETALGRWIWREVFMMDTLRLFIPYDVGRPELDDATRALLLRLGLSSVFSMFGYAITVRREIALKEPFDNHLLAYSPCEDTDVSYRYARHGALAMQPLARLHHFEVGAARLKRLKVAALFLMNVAYLLRKHSQDLPLHRRRYMHLARRRVLAECLKDLLSRRWSLPQMFGTIAAIRRSKAIFEHPGEGLDQWYENQQKEVLAWP